MSQGVRPRDIHLHAPQPKTKFSFDENQPLKCGFLRKQGEKLKNMKERFFVLYPNFLVYYTSVEKWQFDKTVGGLGSRKGAVKLTKARVTGLSGDEVVADCKHPFVLHAPDVTNKRMHYLLDTTSAEERKDWMEAFDKAVNEKAK